jgi:hypothetical protein
MIAKWHLPSEAKSQKIGFKMKPYSIRKVHFSEEWPAKPSWWSRYTVSTYYSLCWTPTARCTASFGAMSTTVPVCSPVVQRKTSTCLQCIRRGGQHRLASYRSRFIHLRVCASRIGQGLARQQIVPSVPLKGFKARRWTTANQAIRSGDT